MYLWGDGFVFSVDGCVLCYLVSGWEVFSQINDAVYYNVFFVVNGRNEVGTTTSWCNKISACEH